MWRENTTLRFKKKEKMMPTVKDKFTGDVVSRQPYNNKGVERAAQIADTNPNWEIDASEDYAPGGSSNAMERSQTMYMGGGKVHKYEHGGAVEFITTIKNCDDAPNPSQCREKKLKFKKLKPEVKKQWAGVVKNLKASHNE